MAGAVLPADISSSKWCSGPESHQGRAQCRIQPLDRLHHLGQGKAAVQRGERRERQLVRIGVGVQSPGGPHPPQTIVQVKFGPAGVRVNAISPGVVRTRAPGDTGADDPAELMMRGAPAGTAGRVIAA
jgi:hypothetical protein